MLSRLKYIEIAVTLLLSEAFHVILYVEFLCIFSLSTGYNIEILGGIVSGVVESTISKKFE